MAAHGLDATYSQLVDTIQEVTSGSAFTQPFKLTFARFQTVSLFREAEKYFASLLEFSIHIFCPLSTPREGTR